ncbi:MAG TPA: hypothetical protein VE968_06635 [Sphingomicrobium sp.]|nr:hypothetical protein [Sphingomicrobium sp.]
MRNVLLLLPITCVVLAGCANAKTPVYTIGNVSVNAPIPQDWTCRTLLKNTIDFRINPSQYIGEVITPNDDGTFSIVAKPILALGSKPIEKSFESGSVYDSKIDKKASASGNYLAIVTASLAANQKMDVDIVDAVHASVPPLEYPDDKLFALAKSKSTIKRFWIAELYISTITESVYSDLSGSTNITAPAFGADGKVYQQSSQTTHDYAVAAKLIDIDDYARNHGKASGGPAAQSRKSACPAILPPGLVKGFAPSPPKSFAILPAVAVRPK